MFALFSCSSLRELNGRIYEVQKQQLTQSPYKSASDMFMFARIKSQKRFRSDEFPKHLKEKLFHQVQLTDTLLLLEDYDEMCVNCPSKRTQILYKGTVYSLNMALAGNKAIYKSQKVKFAPSLNDTYVLHDYYELVEIKNKMKRKETWMANPLEYGADRCLDGNHSLLTAIYPDGKIKSMYVRCWSPEFQRRMRKE